MGPLVKEIRHQVELLGFVQKAVAAAFYDEHTKRVEFKERLKFKEVLNQFCSLLNGGKEGLEFFFYDRPRVKALAATLGIDEAEIDQLREAQERFQVLVLDPRLDEKQRRFLREQVPTNEDRFAVFEPRDASREHLRDAAKALPGALVVLAGDEDQVYLEESEIRTTQVFWDNHRLILAQAPDLVPIPPPPPIRFVDDDGMPMFPYNQYEIDLFKRFQGKSWDGAHADDLQTVREVRQCGGTPTFRADKVFKWISNRAGEEVDSASADAPPSAVFTNWHLGKFQIHLWVYRNQLFCAENGESQFIQTIRKYHPVIEPPAFRRAQEALVALNPWSLLDSRKLVRWSSKWLQVFEMVSKECGIDLSDTHDFWIRLAEKKAEATTLLFQQDPVLEVQAREALKSLLSRPMELDVSQTRPIFILRKALSVSLMALVSQPHDLFHAVTDLGNPRGELLWMRALRFPGEEPSPLRVFEQTGTQDQGQGRSFRLEGGDVHLFMRFIPTDVEENSFRDQS